ncbi:MAG: Crp/Fnr family transcriptional regulator [Actinomycetaceae bacterium]|nr:Crp/Fnr family transcriptional regulator [Actinomycetaceae bacterium]
MKQLPLHVQDDLCVTRVPIFKGLSRIDQERVASLARPMRFHKDQTVSQPAAKTSGAISEGPDLQSPNLMVVHTGSLKVYRIFADGSEQLIRILKPGDFFGESSFLTGEPPHHWLTALEPGSMCVFRHADLEDLVTAFPSIALRMLQTLSSRLMQTETRLSAAVASDVGTRLAEYLLSLPTIISEGGPQVTLPLAKKDVASLLDTTPESLSRQLRRWQDAGVIQIDKNTITLKSSLTLSPKA